MININLKADVSGLKRWLDSVARKQLPFAAAMALNVVGKAAVAAEQAAMRQDLDRPRPFTVNQGVRLQPATKANPEAIVYIPPIQSRYLAPEILGGQQVPNRSRAVLRPIDQATDQYGNLPRALLARLRGRSDIFIGPIETRAGVVNGVWQRLKARGRGKAAKGPGLKLLVRFSDPVPVKTRYGFGDATIATAKANFAAALSDELRKALATAR